MSQPDNHEHIKAKIKKTLDLTRQYDIKIEDWEKKLSSSYLKHKLKLENKQDFSGVRIGIQQKYKEMEKVLAVFFLANPKKQEKKQSRSEIDKLKKFNDDEKILEENLKKLNYSKKLETSPQQKKTEDVNIDNSIGSDSLRSFYEELKKRQKKSEAG